MNPVHEVFPFHEDSQIAAALGELLVQRGTDDPQSVTEVANNFGLCPHELQRAAIQLGIEDELTEKLRISDSERSPPRRPPEFLRSKQAVTREYDGLRDPKSSHLPSRTNEMSFQSWLLVEATKTARESINQLLRGQLGEEVDTIRVSTEAAAGTAPFPERVLWVGVSYPVDATEDGATSAVPNPPPFPFDRLTEILPSTTDATVEHDGEIFVVRNIPVTAFKELHRL
ncbi:hypothetical protein [Haloferax larsenii]|uniref:Uncharacterized protein n=1 Tax=Haloferax larsenii TaxID=302484 RepID=A0A1H7VFK8_HALLR|nr:hypothetical protein [Haloferax larsenii]SEM08061.1 hypothetical protein SAMN04488691_1236 [Haloferax larsenii]